MSERKVRVLHIITKIAVGGAQMNTLISTRDISEKGYPSDILTGPERPSEGDLYDLVREWDINLLLAPHLKREISPVNDLIAFFEIRGIIKDGNYDIVHTHGSKARFLGRLAAASFSEVKIIQTAHGWPFYDSMHSMKKWFYISLEKIGFRLAHANIAVSSRDRDKAVRFGIGSRDSYMIIRSGVDFEEFRKARGKKPEARAKLDLPIDIPVVGSVMRFCQEKAPDIYVKVASLVIKHKPDVLFVLVGDGPLMKQTKKWIESHNLQDSFLLVGSRKDIAEILPAFDLFLITSRTEGLPRALLECLAAGIPVVSTDVGGIHELVDGKRNGLLFPEGDTAALAGGVIRLLDSPSTVTHLLSSVDDDIEPFSARRMVDCLFDLYTEISSPAMNIVFLCDNEPFNIPRTVANIIRKKPFNRYTLISLPGHGSMKKPVLNLKRYTALYGPSGFFRELIRFLSFKAAGFIRLPTRFPHSLKQTASRMHADYIKLDRINSPDSNDLLRNLDPDIFLSLACPQILSKNTLAIPRLGAWNVHSSLLPANRGMLPTFWSLFRGDQPGVTLHKMERKLDAGGILIQKSVDASIENTSVQQLQVESKRITADLVSEGISIIQRGDYKLFKNSSDKATFNYFPSKDDVGRFRDMGGHIAGIKTPRQRVALSFDIEEWFQTYAARKWYPQEQWDSMVSRTPEILNDILDLLSAHKAKATFFFLGWLLERLPELAQKIVQEGHEIGYHGYHHLELSRQSRDGFCRNIDRFQKLVDSLSIPEPIGFRAPSFSVTSGTKWAIDEIVARGYRYDSSIYPMFRHRYGMPCAPLYPFELEGERSSILELPLASIQFLRVKLPAAGGAYMRFYPGAFHRMLIKNISRTGRIPVLYFHPWEIDSLNISHRMSAFQRFRQHHNSGRKTTYRLKRILRIYRGITLGELALEMKDHDLLRLESLGD